jgi:hypothetical protein
MDRFGVGVPFWISGLLVLATLPLARGISMTARVETPEAAIARRISAADVTAEFPVEPVEGGQADERTGGR